MLSFVRKKGRRSENNIDPTDGDQIAIASEEVTIEVNA